MSKNLKLAVDVRKFMEQLADQLEATDRENKESLGRIETQLQTIAEQIKDSRDADLTNFIDKAIDRHWVNNEAADRLKKMYH